MVIWEGKTSEGRRTVLLLVIREKVTVAGASKQRGKRRRKK